MQTQNTEDQTEAQTPASKLSKKQRATNARRHRDEYVLANHGFTSQDKIVELTELAEDRIARIRKHSPCDSIRVRGRWFFNTVAFHELLAIAKSLRGRP